MACSLQSLGRSWLISRYAHTQACVCAFSMTLHPFHAHHLSSAIHTCFAVGVVPPCDARVFLESQEKFKETFVSIVSDENATTMVKVETKKVMQLHHPLFPDAQKAKQRLEIAIVCVSSPPFHFPHMFSVLLCPGSCLFSHLIITRSMRCVVVAWVSFAGHRLPSLHATNADSACANHGMFVQRTLPAWDYQ